MEDGGGLAPHEGEPPGFAAVSWLALHEVYSRRHTVMQVWGVAISAGQRRAEPLIWVPDAPALL